MWKRTGHTGTPQAHRIFPKGGRFKQDENNIICSGPFGLAAADQLNKKGVDVGKDIKPARLLKEYDRSILVCGASGHRDIQVPGRESRIYESKVKEFIKDKNGSLKAVKIV